MQKPSERHKLTSDYNIIKFKKPVHDPFNMLICSKREFLLSMLKMVVLFNIFVEK